MRSIFRARNQVGSSLAEMAASMIVVLPALVAVIFVTLQASQAYLIKNALNDASRLAARNLAKAYELDPLIATSRPRQEQEVLDKIRVPSFIASSAQFETKFDEAADPPHVTVTVKYTGGSSGLPAYPTINLLRLTNPHTIACQSVYRL